MEPRECQLFRVTSCLSDKVHTIRERKPTLPRLHYTLTCIRTPAYTHTVCIHADCLSYVQLCSPSLSPGLVYTAHFSIHRCLLLPVPDLRENLSFPSSRELFFKLVINFICRNRGCYSKRKMAQFQACKCSPPCHRSTSRIHFRCRHVYKISQVKQKHLLCLSNAALATLCRDFLNFRSSGSALGLRVHRCVRYNYWKLVPGSVPVWYFMHNVSAGYLMHSCSGVQYHITYTTKPTHTFYLLTLSHTCTSWPVDSCIGLVIVKGMLCLQINNWSSQKRTLLSHYLQSFRCPAKSPLPPFIHH